MVWGQIAAAGIGAAGSLLGGGPDMTPDIKDIQFQNDLQREQWLDQMFASQGQNITPWGTVTNTPYMTVDPITGQQRMSWAQQTTLPEDLQAAVENQQNLQRQQSEYASGAYGGLLDQYQNPLDTSGFTQYGNLSPTYDPSQLIDYGQPAYGDIPGMGNVPQAFGQVGPELDPSQRYLQSAEDAIYGQFERRAEPRFEQQMSALDTQLRNQGLTPGSEAYDYQMSQLRQSQDDARLGAQYQATQGAGAEASRMLGMDQSTRGQLNQELNQIFGQQLASGQMSDSQRAQAFGEQMTAAQYANALRQQQLGEQGINFDQQFRSGSFANTQRDQQLREEMQLRNLPMQEYGQLAGQMIPGSAPTSGGGYGGQGPNYANAYANAYDQNFNQQAQQYNQQQGLWNTFGQLAGAGINAWGNRNSGGIADPRSGEIFNQQVQQPWQPYY